VFSALVFGGRGGLGFFSPTFSKPADKNTLQLSSSHATDRDRLTQFTTKNQSKNGEI